MLADVCRILEIANPSDVARRLDEDEKMTLDSVEGQKTGRGGAQMFTIISESGLHAVIASSRKPVAKRMMKWGASEENAFQNPINVLVEPIGYAHSCTRWSTPNGLIR